MSVTTPLSDRQQREIEFFEHRPRKEEVDFDQYEKPRFGPWHPTWTVYDFVRRSYRDPSQRLLEFGCGRGQRSLMYARMGYEVCGFDIAPNQVENARELALKYNLEGRTDFKTMVAEKLEYPDDYFDIVAGVNILHHVDLSKAMPELRRVLKPGGIALFRDSLHSPFRDYVRDSWLVKKVFRRVLKGTEDEHPIRKDELAILRSVFPKLTMDRFRVLTTAAKITGGQLFWEKLDWRIYTALPFLRRFGDHVVIYLPKDGLK